MLKSDVMPGQEYAFRSVHGMAKPFHRVRVLSFSPRSRGKVRVEFLDEKREDAWVTLGQLHGSWDKAEGLLRDEQQYLALVEESDAAWDARVDEPVVEAVGEVLAATGEHLDFGLRPIDTDPGVLRVATAALGRICGRAHLPNSLADFGAHAYVDSDDRANIPFEGALRLAKHFAAAEPDAVLDHISNKESRARGYPTLYSVDSSDRAAFALARSWAEDARIPHAFGEADLLAPGYLDVLQRVRVLGAERIRQQAEFQALLQEVVPVLRKRNAEKLARRIEEYLETLVKASSRTDAR